MKISYNWLKEYLDVNLPVNKISEVLTNTGLEVEAVQNFESVEGGLKGVVVGEVITCEQHSNADKLKVTSVNIGGESNLNIVCGAPNVAVGQKVLVATVGTLLPDGKGGTFKIKKGKIRGEESNGMICAEDELGLGDSHDGIMVLEDEAVPGTSASDFLNFYHDEVIEIGLTPNRTDAMGHYGVALDLRAGLLREEISTNLKLPDVTGFSIDNQNNTIPVSIESDSCGQYFGITISDVNVADSPEWLKNRLMSIGLKPINNVVDITNFVLHEIGHPLHAFDADKISSGKISIKTLPQDTTFVTLDEKERKLHSSDLMICDGSNPLCIAGVMGGIHSGVNKNTKNVFLESAWFEPISIRRTAKRHSLNTDASFRYERGVDPERTLYALKRAAILIKEIANGNISSQIQSDSKREFQRSQVDLSYSRINSLIGVNLSKNDVRDILKSLEIVVLKENEDNLKVEVPMFRADVKREADVIEEILRIYGLNNIELPSRMSFSPGYTQHSSSELRTEMNKYITDRGYQEIQNNSLTKGTYYDDLSDFDSKKQVRILNPLSNDLNVLRQSLLFGMLEVVRLNINHKNQDLRLVEFGKTYFNDENSFKENEVVGLAITGNNLPENWESKSQKVNIYNLKGDVSRFLEKFNISTTGEEPFSDDLIEEGVVLKKGNKVIAKIGRVSDSMLSSFDIGQSVFYAEIFFDVFEKSFQKSKVVYSEISKFPSVRRDLALLVDKSVNFMDMKTTALNSVRGILKEVNLFDVYEGKNLPSDKKSYALSFVLQDSNKTLKDKQIDSVMNRLIGVFKDEFGAVLR